MAAAPIDLKLASEAAEAILTKITALAPLCGPDHLQIMADAYASIMSASRTNEPARGGRIY